MKIGEHIKARDPKIYEELVKESERQQNSLEMIPSENFASEAVMEASGSILTNKYSEGYPHHRYYGGNQFIDNIESIAIERAKKLFGVPHANVQPYSGSPANLEVYLSLCSPGDVIMGQNLTDGGHLTHGFKTSVTGKIFKSIPYHVKPDGFIDIEEARRLAMEHKPKLIWVGSTSYMREFPFEEFSKIAEECGAYLAADISHISGLVVSGVHKSPSNYADIITTTTHKTLRGPRGAIIMVTEKGLKKDPLLAEKIDKTVFPGMQGGPHDHTTAAIAIALLEASSPEFAEYSRQIVRNAKALASALTSKGIKLVTGGTDNHLLLIDLKSFGKGSGVFAQEALESAGITTNKNTIPEEPSSPFFPTGIRMGTPAITTRGMKEKQMDEIASIIAVALEEIRGYSLPENREERHAYLEKAFGELRENKNLEDLRKRSEALCREFPLYP